MVNLLAGLSLGTALAALAMAPAAASDSSNRVTFPANGQMSAQVKGSVRGYDTASYVVSATSGQTLAVVFSPNANCYMNIYGVDQRPGRSDALFNGSSSGNRFAQKITQSGDYTTQIYLLSSDAKNKASCSYSMIVTILAPDGSVAINGASDRDRGRGQNQNDDMSAMHDTCVEEAASEFRVRQDRIQVEDEAQRQRNGSYDLQGTADMGRNGGRQDFTCYFDKQARFQDVQADR